MNWFEVGDALVIIGFTLATKRKYRSLLNPVTIYGAFFFISSIVAVEIYRAVGLLDVPQQVLDWCQVLSSIYFGAFGIGYLMRASPFRSVFLFLRKVSRPFCMSDPKSATRLGLPILLAEFAFVYLLLMIQSGAGLMWITNSREAYQLHRTGVGVWWSLAGCILFLAYFVYLVRHGRTVKRVMGGAVIMAIMALLLGSKGISLAFLLLGLFYVHYHLRSIGTKTIVIAGLLLLVAFIGLQLLQGTADSLLSAVLYFDYMPNAARFLNSDFFRFEYGRVSLSSLWFYVPRALYSAKPYAYGQAMISNWLYPGIAQESGATPALIDWTIPYTDFGVFGVIVAGLIAAWISKAAFDLFTEEESIDGLSLAAQLAFPFGIEMFTNCPFPIFWCWFIAQSALFWIVRQAGLLGSQLPERGRSAAASTH